ncbi:receptor-like kinase TMK2 [Raphanus sativus]|nr:receptor-like kinase TMK2 [Raphanus sativus]
MSSKQDLAKLRSICLVICFLAVVTSGRVSPRRDLDSPDLRIKTLFAIVEDIGFLCTDRVTGIIPFELLIKLKNLTILDVFYNAMHGKIPGFRKDVVFAAGNPQIEKDHVTSRLSFVWIGIGIGLLVAGVIGVLYYYVVMRKKGSDLETEPEPTIELEALAI